MTPGRAEYFRDVSKEPFQMHDSIARVIAGWHATRPDLEVDSIAITARLARLQSLMAPKLEEVFARFGLRGADFAVLATLVRLADARVSQRRLAVELGLSAGTMSLRIDRLVRHDLVSRDPDPKDGRGAVITLTDRGRELFEACAPEHLHNSEELLAGLAEDEREQLGVLLGKLLSTLEDHDPDDRLAAELGLVVDGIAVALERRRSVGLPPLPGLLVRHVDPAGTAAASGLRPGDLLRSADRRPLRSRQDLQAAVLQSRDRGRALTLEVTRGVDPMRLRLVTSRVTGS